MFLCLRVDLDYVPWDTPDANEFGHGEPAMLLRLLDLVRSTGHRLHFFVSNRVMRAFPSAPDAVLNEGHDLDWYCKHPGNDVRFQEAIQLFSAVGHRPIGMCVKGSWPDDVPADPFPGIRFVSSAGGAVPAELRRFNVETQSDRDAYRSGLSARSWTDAVKAAMRDAASRDRDVTVVVRPQVLAKFDPRLGHVREMLELSNAVGLPVRTLRQEL